MGQGAWGSGGANIFFYVLENVCIFLSNYCLLILLRGVMCIFCHE